MHIRTLLLGAIALVGLTAGAALADDFAGGAIVSTPMDGHKLLTDARGRTLYVYDKDQAGISNCTGLCAFGWPPMKAESGAVASGNFAPIPARGGAVWAFKGHPLYRYIGDHKPGDITGDGVDGIWHAAILR